MRKIFILNIIVFLLIPFLQQAQPPAVYNTWGSVCLYESGNFYTNSGGLRINIFDTAVNNLIQKHWGGPVGGGFGQTIDIHKIYKVHEAGMGYILWCGYTDVFGTPPSGGSFTAYVVKTNLYGDTVWSHLYGRGNIDGFALASDSNYLFVKGEGYGTIIKVDKTNGDTLWTKKNKRTVGVNDIPVILNGINNSDSVYYTSGTTYPVYWANFMLMKTDTLGNAQWVKAYGDTTANICWGTAQCHDGGFILVGQSAPDDFNIDTLWYHDFLVVRTDANGDTIWCKRYDNNLLVDKAYAVVETDDYGFAIVGTTMSFNSQTSTALMSTLLIKVDSLGNVLWSKMYNPNIPNGVYTISQLSKTSQGGFMWIENFIHVTDSMGFNCMAQPTFVTTGYPQMNVSTIQTYIKHGFDYTFQVYPHLIAPFGSQSIHCTGVGLNEFENYTLQSTIYPNPASNFITITSSQQQINKVEIINVLGKKILRKNTNNKTEIKIDVRDFANGVYFILITDAQNKMESKKFLVQR